MNLRNLSIKRKLTLLAMLTTTMAVMLTSASFLLYDLYSLRNSLRQDLMTDAELIAYNSAAALAFNDEAAAKMQLSAMTAKSDLVAAMLYRPDGRVFARYYRGGTPTAELPTFTDHEMSRVNGQFIEVFSDVTLRGERIGTLFLQSDMQRWHARARQYAVILAVFVFIAGLFAWVVSSKLQSLVSQPILDLEQTMRTVSIEKNYAVRAVKTSGDETGRLIDNFNTMLAEIQHRDKALQRANHDLKTRTKELEGEIVHRKHTQEELLKAKDAAEEASRAKSAFLANMSHELRTPLNAIIGYSEILEEEIGDSATPENIHDLRRIKGAGKHLLSLINDVLDYSKIEAGKMALHLEPFEVEPLLEEVLTTFRPEAERNSNRLELIVGTNAGSMFADVTKVRQILFNLLSNACKFTEHGTITLQVDRQRTSAGERLSFRVTDTGIGMTEQQQQNLFQYFTQADSSTARKYGGTGLGLAISLRFTQMMHGDIQVASELGKGSAFTLELPAEVPEPTPEVESPSPDGDSDSPEVTLPAPTVLVIDDSQANRDRMTAFIGHQGYRVVAASGGADGLRLARQVRPDLITLDLVMPLMAGWQVLDQLKSDPELASIPVVMVTIVDHDAIGLLSAGAPSLITSADRDGLAAVLNRHDQSPVDEVTFAYNGVP